MKKQLVLALFLICFGFNLKAQTWAKKRIPSKTPAYITEVHAEQAFNELSRSDAQLKREFNLLKTKLRKSKQPAELADEVAGFNKKIDAAIKKYPQDATVYRTIQEYLNAEIKSISGAAKKN